MPSIVLRVLAALSLTAAMVDAREPEGIPVEIIAHRGASFDAPENTLASVRLAWEQDADAVEIDVYLSRDGQVVAIHDKTPKRYGGPDRPVAEMTWDELRSLDVGAWKAPQWKGERIPLLEEILPTIPERKRLFIEIKAGPEILPELKRVLAEAKRPARQTAIIGFSAETMRAARETLPDLQIYWIVRLKAEQEAAVWERDVHELIAKAREIDVHGVDLGGSERIDAAFIEALKVANIPWYVWTINDPKEAERLCRLGCWGITTDRPGFLRRELGERAKR